jgi:hypothetical protein
VDQEATSILEVDGLSVRFGQTDVFKNLTFTVAREVSWRADDWTGSASRQAGAWLADSDANPVSGLAHGSAAA